VSTIGALLRLARISNLPTIWSNVLAASVLAENVDATCLPVILLAMSSLYTGGMFLNDAFDRDFDARHRPERPIPAGEIAPRTVWIVGLVLLGGGIALLALMGPRSALAGAALAGAIVLYDAWHKGNPLSPLIMGACRALVYVGTALSLGPALPPSVGLAAGALLLYVAGLTRAAKDGAFQSLATSWPALLLGLPAATALTDGYNVSWLALGLLALAICVVGYAVAQLRTGVAEGRERAVGLLIAAIALMDALAAITHGSVGVALICVGLFFLTLVLQRYVAGT
jgi:4-hydroxybenzoate polyprenyltransferase